MVEDNAKFHLSRWVKYSFHCTDSHETHKYSQEFRGDLLYRISPKSIKECGKYGYKGVYALK
jgi:hypothetical protein